MSRTSTATAAAEFGNAVHVAAGGLIAHESTDIIGIDGVSREGDVHDGFIEAEDGRSSLVDVDVQSTTRTVKVSGACDDRTCSEVEKVETKSLFGSVGTTIGTGEGIPLCEPGTGITAP